MKVSFSLAALLAASLSQAQYLISELSFGHAGRISPPEARGQIPNFAVQGNPTTPEVLSNRIILTPIAPGNQRGSIWGQQPLLRNQWIADVDFRANGPDRGRGNLNIWLVRNGPATIGSGSIYTVGKFDGLALVIDTSGGSSGMIRGFLNDGNTDYARKSNVDELSFGHCPYNYRNLGRPSQIKLRQNAKTFRVEVDGKLCFESDKISIPTGYQFGVTAATPDNPDSFEVFKMVVMADNSDTGAVRNDPPKQQEQQQQQNQNQNQAQARGQPTQDNSKKNNKRNDGEYADEDPDIFQTSKSQFMDLHNRLQNTNHQLASLQRTSSRHQQQDEKRHEDLTSLIGQLRGDMRKLDDITALQSRIMELEKDVQGLRKELTRKLQSTERTFKDTLSDHHSSLSEAVMSKTPGHRFLIFSIIGTQCLLVAAYVVYKRRRASMPKKYL
ncbi:EMP47-like golgi membrane protein [Fusarium heterosporum]|uniref:EMP47-like golgi membrane protein n=1 Tax=Fusarium heterosporum TaxID=42747 RepID=A0A8H5TZ97_FUSHE|nr:EMP47-like golgi membrane protein [Fusarium heterosporum]